jgi:N-acetylglucosamine kinase-like BadF-type ATPase
MKMDLEDKTLYVLGLDGGGSHTKCVILDDTGVELGRGAGGASNHHSIGLDQARQGIEGAMEAALQAAGNPTISAACWGMAGLDWPEDERLIQALAKQLFPNIPVRVVHDSTIALVGGTDGKNSGVVVISGTGSIVVGYHPSGRIERANGWGHLLGDEGSGHYIALQGLTAATRARDGRDRETSLVLDFIEETGDESFESLANRIYLEVWSAPDIAALAPVVINAADQEDRVALDIINRAAEELALGVKVVIEKLGLQGDALDVVLSGGIFTGSPRMVEGTRTQIQSFAPNTSVFLPIREPLIGAGMIAIQSLST